MRKVINMFSYANALPFNSAISYYYPLMVSAIADAGPGFKAPIVKDLAGPCLEVVVHNCVVQGLLVGH
ncbi:hypothetical protein AMTR_s00117p00086080 [Amborella trichopoda]|uniref:Uncharacterized protein n=1 Tax=Amborella trichopoda TaxID=13333 RepID=W1NTN1_AMBTC|nr:hypothetical protein AMTR_s00117p00086080 [Amborella trichopoda]